MPNATSYHITRRSSTLLRSHEMAVVRYTIFRMSPSPRVRRAATAVCAIAFLVGTTLTPLRADASSGVWGSFFSRIGGWFRTVLVRVHVLAPVPAPSAPTSATALPPAPAPASALPQLPKGWTLDRSPLHIPTGTPAAERAAIERAYQLLGGVPVDPRGTYQPNVGPLGEPIPPAPTPEQQRAMDAAAEAAVRRAQEQLR